MGEKCKATQEAQPPHKRTKSKSHKPPSEDQLGLDNYENIATRVQETLDPLMTVLVSSQTTLKSALDIHIDQLKTLMERASQLQT